MKQTFTYQYDKGDLVTIIDNTEGHGLAVADWHKPHQVIQPSTHSHVKVRGKNGDSWNVALQDVKPFFKSRADRAGFIDEIVLPSLKEQLEEQTLISTKLKEYETEEEELYAVLDKIIASGGGRKEIESALIEFRLIKPKIKQKDLSPTEEDGSLHPRQASRRASLTGRAYQNFVIDTLAQPPEFR